MGDISLEQFRNKILLRLLINKLGCRNEVYYEEAVSNLMYATNEILKELHIRNVWARRRGKRIYLFHELSRRIICEVGLDCEIHDHKANKINVILVNLKGILPDNFTLTKIIDDTAKLGVRKKRKA